MSQSYGVGIHFVIKDEQFKQLDERIVKAHDRFRQAVEEAFSEPYSEAIDVIHEAMRWSDPSYGEMESPAITEEQFQYLHELYEDLVSVFSEVTGFGLCSVYHDVSQSPVAQTQDDDDACELDGGAWAVYEHMDTSLKFHVKTSVMLGTRHYCWVS